MEENNKITDNIKIETITGNYQDYNKYLDSIKLYAKNVRGNKNDKKKGITTSQIRVIFGELKKITKMENKKAIEEIQKLRIKLAYTGGRGSFELKNLTMVLEDIIKEIKNKDGIERLYNLVEAIVCYLKFYGDRD